MGTLRILLCLALVIVIVSEDSPKKMAALDLRGVDIKRDGYKLLRRAIKDGDLDNVKLLVEAGANPDIRDSFGYSHLHRAAQKGHLEIVKYLHSQGANIKNQDNGLTTPLWLAAYDGDLPLVEYLANNGADLDTPRAWLGLFPLNGAVSKGYVEVVKFLIEKGADVDTECEAWGSRYGARLSSLEIARDKIKKLGKGDSMIPKYEAIIKLLKDAGAMEGNQSDVDKLVGDTLKAIYGIWLEKFDEVYEVYEVYDGDRPKCLSKLRSWSIKKDKWRMMLKSIFDIIPLDDPLGPTTIALLLRNCRTDMEEYLKLLEMDGDESVHRKISLIISVIASDVHTRSWYRVDDSAGWEYDESHAKALMTPQMLDYLFGNLQPGTHPEIMLYSMLALECFSDKDQPDEHRELVNERFANFTPSEHPVVQIEKKMKDSNDFMEHHLAFCAQWLLDNLWGNDDLEKVRSRREISGTNVTAKVVNSEKSTRLKIGQNDLEVHSGVVFIIQTVVSTVSVDVGCWYYEVTILTEGLMQIGWSSKQSAFLHVSGYGVGDCSHGESYDGCRQVIWYDTHQPIQANQSIKWKKGDVVGALIDIENQEIVISVNGVAVTPEPMKELFEKDTDGFFAAASLMTLQHCLFNFGNVPFKHAPEGRSFKPLNEATNPNSGKYEMRG